MTKLSEKTNWSILRGPVRRLTALFLAAVLVIGLMYIEAPKAEASYWAQDYLDKLVSWGVMRGDINGNLDPERDITRAEFVSMINRAYGYSDVANTPFTDVYQSDWYYDDIGIAYGTGYFSGSSATTASPNGVLTREQAVVLLGRNMRLAESTGEAVSFKDSREFSSWSRGMIESTAKYGIVSGYEDGTFKPTRNITRGEVAAILTRALGTLVKDEGSTSLGSVYGNVTISSAGVTLKDTTIAGDLYLTGGVGLGSVMLENVKVLGKIIVSGAGESHEGDRSIVLRNTTADSMTVDSIKEQFVTISADGDTKIGTTTVETIAYLEDLTGSGFGFDQINFNGKSGSNLQIAGNIKSVKNLTADSTITLAQGTAAEITIDEYARNSTLHVENGAWVQKLNLDTGATVTGAGDIDELIVNSDGSTINIIPDDVNVRPGVSTNINGSAMDSSIATEFSQDPKLLAGYPQVRNIAPTTADAVFSSNKSGTVYWAVSAVSDGSVSEADLINPPSYGGFAMISGNTPILASNNEVSVALTRLTTGGSYYLSAVFVDSRGQRSPVKVVSFTTPDNTVPGFSTGYPYMSRITNTAAQVAVMTTKSCQLYYALLPQNSTAPTVADFKANAVAGNLGFGTMEATKNSPLLFYVNGKALDELQSYDLYLWLTDFDGTQSSAVRKLTFRTVDMTPPEFLTEPTVTTIRETTIALNAAINEQGTIYWAVVKEGTEYPKPLAGQTVNPALNSDTAKLQVANGMNCLRSGRVAARATAEVTINVTGLEAEKAYDFYYLAQDAAGNYSEWVKFITIHTLDTKPPTVTQEFTLTADEAGTSPLPGTDIKVIFSESIQHNERNNYRNYYKLYQTSVDASKSDQEKGEAKQALLDVLGTDIVLMDASSSPAKAVDVLKTKEEFEAAKDSGRTNWVYYDGLEISMEDGQTVFLFEHDKNISLSSGGTYYFQLANISDTSDNMNAMSANSMRMPTFRTVFAQVSLSNGVTSEEIGKKADGSTITPHMTFTMKPISTQSVADNIYYDVLLWSDKIIEYNLYGRVLDKDGESVTGNDALMGEAAKNANNKKEKGWVLLGEKNVVNTPNYGNSVQKMVSASSDMPKLNTMKENTTYEFAIELTRVGTVTNPSSWSDAVTISVTVPAGIRSNIDSMSSAVYPNLWAAAIAGGNTNTAITPIGDPENFTVYKQFQDTAVPKFTGSYPTFKAGDSSVTMQFQLDRAGTVYYVIAPVFGSKDDKGNESTYGKQSDGTYVYSPAIDTRVTDSDGKVKRVYPNATLADGVEDASDFYPLKDGKEEQSVELSAPGNLNIYSPKYSSSLIKTGNVFVEDGIIDVTVGNTANNRLLTMTTYYVYVVLKGASQNLSKVYCFQFTTAPVGKPIITLNNYSPSVEFKTSTDAVLDYMLIPYADVPTLLSQEFSASGSNALAINGFNATELKLDASADGVSGTFSVLDALLNSTPDGWSVFDEYALPAGINDIRKNVADYIRGITSYSGNRPTDMGSFGNLVQNVGQTKNFTTAMSAGSATSTTRTMYYCLAVAHHAQGTVDSFRAIKNIQNPDKVAPEFKSVTTSATKDATGNTYSGTVTIEFDKPIYFISGTDANNIAKPVLVAKYASAKDDDATVGTGTDKVQAVYFQNHVTATGVAFAASGQTQTALSTITFNFSGARIGSTFIIFNDGAIANQSSTPSSKRLTLTFKEKPKFGDTIVGTNLPGTETGQEAGFAYRWG